MTGRRLPRYVSEFIDRHGQPRLRFRRRGFDTHYFANRKPWSPEFMAEYQRCLDGVDAAAVQPGASRTKPGSVSAAIIAWYRSPEFTGVAPSTQATYRGIVERFRADYGELRIATLERRHIKEIIGKKAATPAAANNLLRMLRTLLNFAVEVGMRPDNPALGVRGFRRRGDGFHTWSEEEIAAFEARHSIGTKARLALGLMLFTGQRRSDAVRMGWQHVAGGAIFVRQQKTGTRLEIPVHPELARILDGAERKQLTFLTTSYGKAFTPAGFGNWFRQRCDEAGLPHCAAHGLRKAAARRLAEAGCSNQVIKSITGHKSDREVSIYTEAADQKVRAAQAIRALGSPDREQDLANLGGGLAKTARKPLKGKAT